MIIIGITCRWFDTHQYQTSFLYADVVDEEVSQRHFLLLLAPQCKMVSTVQVGSEAQDHSLSRAGDGRYQERWGQTVSKQCNYAVHLGQMAVYDRLRLTPPIWSPWSAGPQTRRRSDQPLPVDWILDWLCTFCRIGPVGRPNSASSEVFVAWGQ